MTQEGIVTRRLSEHTAEVAVSRGTACGGHCSGGCEACVYDSRILVQAENLVYAAPGDGVVLETATGGIVGAAMLIYLVPLVFFFAGLGAGMAAGLGQGLCVLCSLAGAAVGAAVTVIVGRRKKNVKFRITGFTG